MRLAGALLLPGLLLPGLLLAPAAAAQDIEALSALTRIPLPPAYYERVREDPDAFELPGGLFRRTPDGPVPVAALAEGTVRLPVVLALFADSREPHITRAQVQASLFDGPAPAGTLTDFYLEMSRGRLRVTGDVLPWVRTSLTMAQVVGDSYGLGGTGRIGEYLVEALARVDEEVDFSQYDSTGDGVVDAVVFEFLEIAASCGGPAIWPHRSGVARWVGGEPYATNDLGPDGQPVLIDGYIIQSASDCSGASVQDASVVAHEFGHVLGLPDFYHPIDSTLPENRRWVLGCWELMAAGAWGCGPVGERVSFGPTHMMAAQKRQLGWVDYVTVGEVWDEEFVLGPVQTTGRALRVPLDPQGIESLIIEYRTRFGFDHLLPAEGVLITHSDVLGSLRPRGHLRYRQRLVEADGNEGLVRTHLDGGNRGEAGDLFGVDGRVGRLNAFTTPALLRNVNGAPTTVAIHSITVAGGEARVRLSTAATPRVMVPASPVAGSQGSRIATPLRVAGGLMPYTVLSTSGGPEGVLATAVDDEIVFLGAAREMGAFEMVLRLGDADGRAFEAIVPVTVEAFFVSTARLLQPLLRTNDEPLSAEERARLDELGNANGAFDVGDVRAWLLRGPE